MTPTVESLWFIALNGAGMLRWPDGGQRKVVPHSRTMY